jgi:hypothetical protein
MRAEKYCRCHKVFLMKTDPLKMLVSLALSASVLAACGGGDDDEAGAPESFHAVPADVTRKGDTAAHPDCATTDLPNAVEIFVFGGTAPYQLKNSNPTLIVLNKQVVANPKESFIVSMAHGCYDPANITIVDSLNNTFTVNVHSIKGDTAT